jgi:hypothetical protein
MFAVNAINFSGTSGRALHVQGSEFKIGTSEAVDREKRGMGVELEATNPPIPDR